MHEARLDRPVFLGGAPRSGLTLLRALLDGHPRFSAGPDAWIVSMALTQRDMAKTLGALLENEFAVDTATLRRAFAAAIGKILSGRATLSGKARIVEKTPLNVLVFTDLASLFPHAQFVHVVRDGRDVAASLLERAWKDPRTGRLLPQCADSAGAGRYWSQLASEGLSAERALGERILRLAYEDIVREPQLTLRRLLEFLGEPYAEEMLDFPARALALIGMEQDSAAGLKKPLHVSQVGRWRRELDAGAQAMFGAAAGTTLRELGYA
jgi:hypothetical protein